MNTILDVKDLVISFENDGQMVEAVRNISFNIPVGKTVALVGEYKDKDGNRYISYFFKPIS